MFRRSHHPDPDEVVLRLRRPGRAYDEPPSNTNNCILHKEKLRSSRILCAKFSPGRDIRVTWNHPESFRKYVRWLHEREFQSTSVKDTLACMLFSQKVEDSEFCKDTIDNLVILLKGKQKRLKDYLDRVKPLTIGEWGLLKGDHGFPAHQNIRDLIVRFATLDNVREIKSASDLYPPKLCCLLEKKHGESAVSENASSSQNSKTAAQIADMDGNKSQTDASQDKVPAGIEHRGHNDTMTNGLGIGFVLPLPPNADMAAIIEAINRTLLNGQNMHYMNPDSSVGNRIADSQSNSDQPVTHPVQSNGGVTSQQCSSTEKDQTTNAKQGSPQEKIAGDSPHQKATSTSGSSTAMIQAKQDLDKQMKNPQQGEKVENKPNQASAGHDKRPSTLTEGHEPDEQKAGVKGQEVAVDLKASDDQEKPCPNNGDQEGGDRREVEQGSNTDEDRKEGEDESACQS